MSKKKRVFIMAGGSSSRWRKSGGEGKKEMALVDGAPVIHRTLRQVADHDVFLVCEPKHAEDILVDFGAFDCELIDSTGTGEWCAGFLATAKKWGRNNICLLGDVWFSDRAMKRLLAAEGLHVLGRRDNSPITQGTGETFALTWHKRDNPRLVAACNGALAHARAFPEGTERDSRGCPLATPWQPYRILAGFHPEQHETDQEIWMEHSDFTDDFDFFPGYKIWTERFRRRMIKQPPLQAIGLPPETWKIRPEAQKEG